MHLLRLAAIGLTAILALIGGLAVACSNDGGEATVTATATSAALPTATPTPTPSFITQVDGSGFEMVMEAPASRIVSHSPGATEILFAIGAGDQVLAVDKFSNYPASTAALPKVEYSAPDPEQDLAFEPDLVIFTGRHDESVAQFRNLDIPVFLLAEPKNLAGVGENIIILGRLSGHEAEAEALAASLSARVVAIQDALAAVEQGPRVYYELTADLYTVSPASFIGQALDVLRLRNIVTDTFSAFPQLSAEAIVEGDPEVILLANVQKVSVESVTQRPGWAGISAVREDQIYELDPDVWSRPGPRIVDGMEAIARLLYPEQFP